MSNISEKTKKLCELRKKIEDSLSTSSGQADALKLLSESEEFNGILKEKRRSRNVDSYYRMLYGNDLEKVYDLLKDKPKYCEDNFTLNRKNILENAKYVLDEALPKRKIKKIDKKELKRLGEKIIDNKTVGDKMIEEYEKKVEEVGNDEGLREILANDLKVLLLNSTTKYQNFALDSLKNGGLTEFKVKEYKRIIDEFPSIIAGFEAADKKFNKKYEELKKKKEEELMKGFRELLKLEKEKSEELEDKTFELEKSGISGTNVKELKEELKKSKIFLKAIEDNNNPQKMEQGINTIIKINNKIEGHLTESFEEDKTSKGKSRLKRFKEWSKKFSKKLKIKKINLKSKK